MLPDDVEGSAFRSTWLPRLRFSEPGGLETGNLLLSRVRVKCHLTGSRGTIAFFLSAAAYQALYEARRSRDPSTVATWREPLDLNSWFRRHPILTALLLAWVAITVFAVSLG